MSFARWTVTGLVVLATMAVSALPAAAQEAPADRAQAEAWCVNREKVSMDRQIAGCTSLIEAGQESVDNIAIAFSNRGNAYRLKGELDRAIADYDQAIKRDPKSATFLINRGAAYSTKGQYDRAIQDYDEAIKLDRRQAVAFNNRGFANFNLGQHDRAIADYDEAIKLFPRYVAAIINRGNAWRAKGDTRRAIRDFDQALMFDPVSATPCATAASRARPPGTWCRRSLRLQRFAAAQAERRGHARRPGAGFSSSAAVSMTPSGTTMPR